MSIKFKKAMVRKPSKSISKAISSKSLTPSFAKVFEEHKNYIDALKDTERILEVDPNNKDVQLVRALIYQEKGDLELSLDELEKAIELNPDDAALQKLKTTIEGQLQQEIQKKDVPPDPNEEGGVVKRTKYYDDLYCSWDGFECHNSVPCKYIYSGYTSTLIFSCIFLSNTVQ